MKALKILGVLVGLIFLAGFVFWFGWLRAPAPEDVCQHMSELMKKESGVEMPKDTMTECISNLAPPEFGKLPYAEQMNCMMDAESSADLDKC